MSQSNSTRVKSPGTISPADVPLQQLPVVELSAEQVQQAEELAKDRNRSYAAIDGGSVYGGNEALTSHMIGILGELAVALLYASSIDMSTYRWGDGGTDLPLWGKEVDVKATATDKMALPQLLVCEDNDLTADLYLLVHIIDWGPSGAKVRVLGYCSRAHVENRQPRRHPGNSKNYVVEPGELTVPPLLTVCDS